MSSANRGRRRRAERNLDELVMQAHDRLHKDDVGAAHELLHAALGLEEPVMGDVAPLAQRQRFDEAFRQLCIREGVRASYVLIDRVESQGRALDRVRLCSGGDGELCQIVDEAVRAAS